MTCKFDYRPMAQRRAWEGECCGARRRGAAAHRRPPRPRRRVRGPLRGADSPSLLRACSGPRFTPVKRLILTSIAATPASGAADADQDSDHCEFSPLARQTQDSSQSPASTALQPSPSASIIVLKPSSKTPCLGELGFQEIAAPSTRGSLNRSPSPSLFPFPSPHNTADLALRNMYWPRPSACLTAHPPPLPRNPPPLPRKHPPRHLRHPTPIVIPAPVKLSPHSDPLPAGRGPP
jgi:hypothetical protein